MKVKIVDSDGRNHELELPATATISDAKESVRDAVYGGRENFELRIGGVCPIGIDQIGLFGADTVELSAISVPPMKRPLLKRSDVDYSLVVEPEDIEERINTLMNLGVLHSQDRRLARDALYAVNFDLDRAAEVLLTMNGERAPRCLPRKIADSPSDEKPLLNSEDAIKIKRISRETGHPAQIVCQIYLGCGKDEEKTLNWLRRF
jgi:hypothetical protein